jgi:hypothetical protein
MTISDLPDSYLSDGASNGAKRTKKTGAKLKDGAAMMQDRMSEAADGARAYADRTLEQINALSRTALEKAKERPAVSALAILGIGLALGAIIALAAQKPVQSFADSALDEATRLRRKLRR